MYAFRTSFSGVGFRLPLPFRFLSWVVIVTVISSPKHIYKGDGFMILLIMAKVKPFRVTETERYYLIERTWLAETEYALVRVYRLQDDPSTISGKRWIRQPDEYYEIRKEVKYIEYTRNVYYRGTNRKEYYEGEISVTLEIPERMDPDLYWDEAHRKMDDLMETEAGDEYVYHWSSETVTEKTGTRMVQSLLDGSIVKKATHKEQSGAYWRRKRYEQ